ncbi:hypothetical protein [Luteibacter sp. UNC138MFCol5.1]|uniref:hypothetical protein n=1 Tax=Luteibacter sp. UNC138MFCol5.1 TaxID=1502774 RepID=UPI001160C305|nr:hypothetical protein [Luteibacter sp. UNC138MFCol5.1]
MPIRILAAVQLRPMTVREIACALSATDERVRLSVLKMEADGRLMRAGFGAKASRRGTTPYLWRAA